jgi:hypothetical protein
MDRSLPAFASRTPLIQWLKAEVAPSEPMTVLMAKAHGNRSEVAML